MDRTDETWPDIYYFWDLVEETPGTEFSYDFVSNDTYQHISVLRFTGGTTGKAKCAMYSQSNLWVWGCNPAHYYETFPYDHPRAMLFSPLNHAASGSVVIPVHIKGGTIITLNKADTEMIGQAIAEEKTQMIYTVPTVLYRILDINLPRKYDLSSLRTIRYGAASISPSKLKTLLAVFGQIFVQGYGSTECWPSITILARKDHGTENEEQVRKLSSIGRPFPGEEVIICDDEGEQVPTGQKGELWVRGINTIQGYYKDPDQTRQNFSEKGFWKSGDIGYMDEEGYVYLVDRKKDMIITGGFNVYATEVENCINSHPDIKNSAVFGIPDDYWGERVCAEVVLREGTRITQEELNVYCKGRLSGYKVPKTMRFVDELPLSPAGKVLKRLIRERYLGKAKEKAV